MAVRRARSNGTVTTVLITLRLSLIQRSRRWERDAASQGIWGRGSRGAARGDSPRAGSEAALLHTSQLHVEGMGGQTDQAQTPGVQPNKE